MNMLDRDKIVDSLLEQHAALRRSMQRCEQLSGDDQADAVDDLRCALDAHNRYEERMLRQLLHEPAVDRLSIDHAAEHVALNDQLQATNDAALRVAFAHLRTHLEAEERSFLSAGLYD